MLGVGAVYELPKKVLRVGEAEAFQLMSADVSMPRGHGGVEAREYIRFALGRWRLLLWGAVHQGLWGVWVVVVRKAWSIGPKRPCGSTVNGMRTMFLSYSSPMTLSPWMNGEDEVAGLCARPSLERSWR